MKLLLHVCKYIPHISVLIILIYILCGRRDASFRDFCFSIAFVFRQLSVGPCATLKVNFKHNILFDYTSGLFAHLIVNAKILAAPLAW